MHRFRYLRKKALYQIILSIYFPLGLLMVACGGSNNEIPVRTDPRPNIIVVLTDDQGYSDVFAQGIADDVKTQNIDSLAQHGIRMTAGYDTAPQCAPSRAGLLTGRYQQSFGLDTNSQTPLPLTEVTIADRMRASGYATGFVGKWHLEIDNNSKDWYLENYPSGDVDAFDVGNLPLEVRRPYFPDSRGFDEVYFGALRPFWCNFNLKGEKVAPGYVMNMNYRVDVISSAARAFIHMHRYDPFYLVVSYFAPHIPLEAPAYYLNQIPTNMPQRRRYALAMLKAVDTGVGTMLDLLDEYGLVEDTLIFFVSDNGAPLGITMDDLPISDISGVWDGSLNDPWIGEKGMLSEGGIRVPFIVQWRGTLPEGQAYHGAVSTLDIGATALSLSKTNASNNLDGIDLVSVLKGESPAPEDRALFWRFWNQAAVRKGQWKYLLAGEYEFLFNLNDMDHEYVNLIKDYPDIANQLRSELSIWTESLQTPGLPPTTLYKSESDKYDAYFDLP